MYKCTNSYNSREGKRFAMGEMISSSVFYRLPHEERKNFKQDFGADRDIPPDQLETKTVLPRYEGGFNAGSTGFSHEATDKIMRQKWPPEQTEQ